MGNSPSSIVLCIGALLLYTGTARADRLYVSNEASGNISIVDTEVHRVVETIPAGGGPKDLQLSPDRRSVYVATSDGIAAIGTESSRLEPLLPGGAGMARFSIGADGRLFIAQEDAGTATIFSPGSKEKPISVKLAHKPEGIAVKNTFPNIRAYVTSGADNLVLVVDPIRKEVVATIAVPARPRGIAVLPDGSKAYVACEESGQVAVLDLKSDLLVKTIALNVQDAFPTDVSMDSTASRVYVTGKGGVLFSIDTDKDEPVASVKIGGRLRGVALSGDGKRIYTASEESNEVFEIDARNFKVTHRIPVGKKPWGLALLHLPSKQVSKNGGPYRARCASCHDNPTSPTIPSRDALSLRLPEFILSAMEHPMAPFAKGLSQTDREALATYLTQKPFDSLRQPLPKSAFCRNPLETPFAPDLSRGWNGWGGDEVNSRYQPPARAGLTSKDVGSLKLKWAFGFRGAMTALGQPTVIGGRVFVSAENSRIYSLDARSGCVYWESLAGSGRTAISIGQISPGHYAAFLGTFDGSIVALDAQSGKLLWSKRVDEHPTAMITGSPKIYGDRLYVPVSSTEEDIAMVQGYECCTFRGSLVALDIKTGDLVWKSYLIPDAPRFTHTSPSGTRFFGTGGVGVWNSPVVDLEKKLIYVGTGNAYSSPPTGTSNSLVGIEMASGKIAWVYQHQGGTYWNEGCGQKNRTEYDCMEAPPHGENEFVGSSLLLRLSNNKRLLIGSARRDLVAVDPDHQGKRHWVHKWDAKGLEPFSKVAWSPAMEGGKVFFGLDRLKKTAILALDPETGNTLWEAEGRGVSGALTTIEGAVLAGDVAGILRAYSTADGHQLWEFPTARPFKTVNGIQARGGAIDGGGPTVADGMLFVNSGYSRGGRTLPGNVLLAFSRR